VETAPTAPVGVLDLAGIPTVDADGRRLTGKERRRLLWLQRKEQRKQAAAEAAPAGLAASKPPILLKARRKAGDGLAVAADVAAGVDGGEDALLPHSGAGAADVGVGIAEGGFGSGGLREEEVYSEENGYYHTEAAPPLLYTTAPAGEIDARRQLKQDAEEGAEKGAAGRHVSDAFALEARAPPLMEAAVPLQHPPQHQQYGRGTYEGGAADDRHARSRAGMAPAAHTERETAGGYRPGLLPPPQHQQAPGRGHFGAASHHGSYGAARDACEGGYGSTGGYGRRDGWEAAGAGGVGEPAHFDGAAAGPSGYRAPPQHEAGRPYAGGYAEHGEGPRGRVGGPDAWRGRHGSSQQPYPERRHGGSGRGIAPGPSFGRDAPAYMHAGAGTGYHDHDGRSGYEVRRGAAGAAEEMGYRGGPPSRDPHGGYAPGSAAGDRHYDVPRDTPPAFYREEGPYGGPPEGYARGVHNGRGGVGGSGGYEHQYGQRFPGEGRASEASGGGWAPPPHHSSGHAAGGPPEHRSDGYYGGGRGRYR
jgi:hypothetical protein